MVTEDVPQENIDKVHQRLEQSKATQTETENQFQTPGALSGTTARSYNLAQEPRKSYVDVDVRERINTMSATTYNNGATAEAPMVPSDFHDGSQLTYLDTLASQRDSLKRTATSKLKLIEQRLRYVCRNRI